MIIVWIVGTLGTLGAILAGLRQSTAGKSNVGTLRLDLDSRSSRLDEPM